MNAITRESLEAQKTVELRKLAKTYDVKTTGGRPVNSGRKADLIDSILRSIETLRTRDEAVREAARKSEKAAKAAKVCFECGKAKIDFKTQGRDSTMCEPCFEYAGWENTHSDDGHDDYATIAQIRQNRIDFDDAHVDVRLDEMRECPVCEEHKMGPFALAPSNATVGRKALRFEADAKAAGWTALARNSGARDGVSLVTARRGDEEITLAWDGSAYDYDASEYKAANGKVRKIRNASAARSLLAS